MGIKAKEANPMFADKLYSLSDEDLVIQYGNTRSQKVFREIYRRYGDPLFRYCAQMAPRRCALLMEQFWNAFLQSPPQLHDRRLKNWLYIRVNRLLQTSEESLQTAEAQDESLCSALENSEVLRAVQQLPRRERNVFLLFTECGLSLATVADIEKLPLVLCRALLRQSREAVQLAVHGSARKPWKSASTMAREAAALAAAQQGATKQETQGPATPKKPATLFPWKTAPEIAVAHATPADRSVEVV
ncbi:RNA polymerase sigma factor [Microbulbifer harenosus]|uniref:Sigma-70 family RNA polymerase sigma factor n=1 Tax=Microbulbifer harenosus TaxID=2576840 RepID=A0ABY2UKA5_9GAMM|nr:MULTISPECIES: sigma-70 family RNA polymerase sigma factor [Microbulbifer]QIL89545.1 hypothetical protein GNX18_07095 [Microbulbifer sp. SH-1]TLM78399.1 sigma-70 family RNA polymerase sigma factor [Microbulbifer harenosus]